MKTIIKSSIIGLSAIAMMSTSVQASDDNSTLAKKYTLGDVSFSIDYKEDSIMSSVTITPSGIKDSEVINKKFEGRILDIKVADLNNDSYPELYIFTISAGSGSIGSVLAYSSNKNQSLTPIYLAELSSDKVHGAGYMGHDSFAIAEDKVIRSFPIYKKDDANCCPKGGTRVLEYKLVAGEAGWLLKIAKSTSKEQEK